MKEYLHTKLFVPQSSYQFIFSISSHFLHEFQGGFQFFFHPKWHIHHYPLLPLLLHISHISAWLCLVLCFPPQEASVVPWDHLRLCDHHCSSSCIKLPWFFMPGVEHAYPLTGRTVIWGQKVQNNNLPSLRLLTVTMWCLLLWLPARRGYVTLHTFVFFPFYPSLLSPPPPPPSSTRLSLSYSPSLAHFVPLSLVPSSMWTLGFLSEGFQQSSSSPSQERKLQEVVGW